MNTEKKKRGRPPKRKVMEFEGMTYEGAINNALDKEVQADLDKCLADKDESQLTDDERKYLKCRKEKKSYTLNVRFTESEMQDILARCEQYGYKNKTEYIRDCVRARVDLTPDRNEIAETNRLMKRIGANINQILVRLYSTGHIYAEDIMESKRLGLCTKSLFAVPNHLTEQIGDDFQKLYPGANILVATKKDFKKENRQQLFAKIATGNYDAVIIGHSQLGKIPVSKERQVMTIQTQIDDILQGIEELKKSEGSKFQIKAMERTRKGLQKQLDKLEKTNQDDTLTFEQLGIDRLFVDEAHEFKNLFVATKLQNVAGISNSASQKALDLFLKCRYLDEKTGGKGVIFATGTPYASPYQH